MLNDDEFVVINVRPQPRQRSHTAGHIKAHLFRIQVITLGHTMNNGESGNPGNPVLTVTVVPLI